MSKKKFIFLFFLGLFIAFSFVCAEDEFDSFQEFLSSQEEEKSLETEPSNTKEKAEIMDESVNIEGTTETQKPEEPEEDVEPSTPVTVPSDGEKKPISADDVSHKKDRSVMELKKVVPKKYSDERRKNNRMKKYNPGQNWKKVWADEFNKNKLNKNNWTHDIGYGPMNDGWSVWGVQKYTSDPQNIYVEDGKLVLKAIYLGGGKAILLVLASLGKYAFTVILGLAVHGLIILPLLLYFFAKRNPFDYFYNMLTPLGTAFSTASSSATLPLTLECSELKNKISPKVAGLVLPLGATINMDGTAMYEAVAAIFIAQAYGIDLTVMQQVIIFFTATLASIGAAGIPEAGLVTMILVLKAVNLPVEGIALILTIDWFLDRCRTTVNVWGDSIGAAVVEKFSLGNKAFKVQ